MRSTTIAAVLLLLGVAASQHVMAQVYRCQMPNGGTQFSDTPCPTSAVKAERHMDSRATRSEWVPDGYRLQEQLDSANRARALRRAQVDGEEQRWAAPAGAGGPVVFGDGRQARDQDREKFFTDAERRTSRARLSAEERARLEYFERQRESGVRAGRSAATSPPNETSSATHARDDAPNPFSRITQCDSFRCRDNAGNNYQETPNGEFRRSDGKVCSRSGSAGTVFCF